MCVSVLTADSILKTEVSISLSHETPACQGSLLFPLLLPVFLRSRCRTVQMQCLTFAHYLRFLKETSEVKQAVHCLV